MSRPITMEENEEPLSTKEQVVVIDPTPPTPPPKKRVVRNLEILEYLIGTIAGTDKFSKVAKYTLDVIKAIVISRPNSVLARLISLIPNFRSKATYASSLLSTYRYILRFGYTPFALSKLFDRLKGSIRDPSKANKIWMNEDALNNVLDLYYGVFDELDTLYRLKVWQNPKVYIRVVTHQCWAWEAFILLGLKNNFKQLNSIKSEITQLEVQRRVKSHAMQLSASLHDQGPRPDSFVRQQLLQDLNKNSETAEKEQENERQLQELRHQRLITYLDIARLSFDCAANLSDLLHIPGPAYTYSVLSLGSGVTGLYKMWINAAKALSSQ
ncbi:hypothetical protein ZYGR_0AS04590 [Zygosaccharomyces rouxii]|uniref:Peroxisomal membrane protein PEX25 n=1 Tax=Zygosaccharomyces rouxii TaxID=4956 RepID=A0A1Q3AHK2_ZYGRO|nr:hypothetical protein ZYGR_0AS04590 [Zygosaccharomyces rouxii]